MLSRRLVQYGLRQSRVQLCDSRETHRKCIYSFHVNYTEDLQSLNYMNEKMSDDSGNGHFNIEKTSVMLLTQEIVKHNSLCESNIKNEKLRKHRFVDMKMNLMSTRWHMEDNKMKCLLYVEKNRNLTVHICKFSSSAFLSEKCESDLDFQGKVRNVEDKCKFDELNVANCDKECETSVFVLDQKLDKVQVYKGQTKTGEVQLKEADPQSLVLEKNKHINVVLSCQQENGIIPSDSIIQPKSALQTFDNKSRPSALKTFESDSFSQVFVPSEPNMSVSKTDEIPNALFKKNNGKISEAVVDSEEQLPTESSIVNHKTYGSIKKHRKRNKAAQNLKSDVTMDPLPDESYSLAPYVDHSDTLKQLVMLGVDLSKIERKKTIANYVLRLDFDQYVKPVLYFFKDIGIKNEDLASIITKNPYVLSNLNLEVIVEYLRSKKFEEEGIQRLILKCPAFLSMDVKEIDEMLGFYQKEFKLTGNEVRKIITQQPKLIDWDQEKFKVIKHHMKELLGFSEGEMKKIFLIQPFVYLSDKHDIVRKFDFLHNNMGLTHEQMVQWPYILRSRLSRIKSRHKYLVHLGKNQYNGKLEKYVSLKALVSQSDEEWCQDVAKTEVKDYYNFLKTI